MNLSDFFESKFLKIDKTFILSTNKVEATETQDID